MVDAFLVLAPMILAFVVFAVLVAKYVKKHYKLPKVGEVKLVRHKDGIVKVEIIALSEDGQHIFVKFLDEEEKVQKCPVVFIVPKNWIV